MKKVSKYKTGIGVQVIYALLLMSLTSCDFSGIDKAIDNFDIVVELDSINTNSTVLLTDAKTGELITEEVRVTFVGSSADDVIDMYSDPMPARAVQGGIITFGLHNSITPSSSAPVHVQLVLQANGYLTSTRTVSINKEGNNTFSFKMIKEGAPPAGAVSLSNTEGWSDHNGVVQQAYEVAVRSDVHPENGLNLYIPEGLVFKDADGQPLTGQLTTRLWYYDPAEPAALESLPPGLTMQDGTIIYTAGVFTIQITDEQGRVAASASPSSSAKATPHLAESGSAELDFIVELLVGDADLPEGDEAWSREDYLKILNKLLQPEYDATAPGTQHEWTDVSDSRYDGYIGWRKEEGIIDVGFGTHEEKLNDFWAVIRSLENSPGSAITIERSGYSGSIEGNISIFGATLSLTIPAGTNSFELPPLPDAEFSYEFQIPYNRISGTHNFNTEGNLTITLPPPPANVIDAEVQVALQCQDPDAAVRVTNIPGASVVYRKTDAVAGTSWKTASNLHWNYDEENQRLTGGGFNISGVERGASYTFVITYDGETYERGTTVTGETVRYTEVITDDICK